MPAKTTSKVTTVAATNPLPTTTQGSTTTPGSPNVVTGNTADMALKAALNPPIVTVAIDVNTTMTTTQSQVGLQFGSVKETKTVSLGSSVVDTSVLYNIRSKLVSFSAYHLKPLTKLCAFFDNVNVDSHIFPATRMVLDKPVHTTGRTKKFTVLDKTIDVLFAKKSTVFIKNTTLAVGSTFTWDSITYTVVELNQSATLETDKNGYVAGTFLIPNSDTLSFKTGTRAFLICDSVDNNAAEIKTAAEFAYYASGMTQSKQSTTLATRINHVTIDPMLKSQSTESSPKSASTQTTSPAQVASPLVITLDDAAPIITYVTPTQGSTNIPVTASVVVTFNEPILPSTAWSGINLLKGAVAIPCTSTIAGSILTITPLANLGIRTVYKINLPYDCLKDASNNTFGGSNTYSFTSGALLVESADVLAVSFFPSDGAIGVDPSTDIKIEFNQAIVRGTGLIKLWKIGPVSTLVVDTATPHFISTLGTTTQLEWNRLASTTGITYIDGSTFTFGGIPVVPIGTGTGVVGRRIDEWDVGSTVTPKYTITGKILTLNPIRHLENSGHYLISAPNTAIKSVTDPVNRIWVGTDTVGTGTYDFTIGIGGSVVTMTIANAPGSFLNDPVIIDFTTATGICGFDITSGIGYSNESDSPPDAFLLMYNDKEVPECSSGGSLTKPVYLTCDTYPYTALKALYPRCEEKFSKVSHKPTLQNPLQFRFDKTTAEPTRAYLMTTRNGAIGWNSVLPPGVIVVQGKADFSLAATNPPPLAWSPTVIKFTPGEPLTTKVHSLCFDLKAALKSTATKGYLIDHWVDRAEDVKGRFHTDFAYINANGTTSHAERGSGFITFPAGHFSSTWTITNIASKGSDVGSINSISLIDSFDGLDSPGLGLISGQIIKFVSNIRLFNAKAVEYKTTPTFPISLLPGEFLKFTVNIDWPHIFYTPPFNWAAKTGLPEKITVGQLKALPSELRESLVTDFEKEVVEVVSRLAKTLLRWEVVPGYVNDKNTVPKSGNIMMDPLKDPIPPLPRRDPLAQTFFVNKDENPDGYFVSSVDLFFKEKSTTEDITVQIRPVINGFPSAEEIVPFAISSLSSDDVVTTSYPSDDTKTKFKFDSPIYLSPGTYAIVVISSSTKYELFTSTVGNFILNDLDERISKQPYIGDLFKSSNSLTWLPSPYQDLCFVINKCTFLSSGTVAFTSRKPISNKTIKYNQFIPLTHFNKNSIIRVETTTNIDNVYIVANSGTVGSTAPTHLSGSVLNGDVNLTFVSTQTRWEPFRVPFDVLYIQGENVTFDNNTIEYSYKATNTTGDIEADFTALMKDTSYELLERKEIDSETKNLYAKIAMGTTDKTLSPIVDLNRFSNVLVRNIVNYDTIASDFVPEALVVEGDFIKVLFDNAYKMYSVIRSGVTSEFAPTFDGSDTLNGGALLRYVGQTNNGDTELLPAGGKALSKYITRKVVLADGFESNELVVRFNANTPPGASVKVYYKAASVVGYKTLEQTPYIEMVLAEREADFVSKFVEHKFICDYGDVLTPEVRYALPNKQQFNQFIVKIVMLSTNTVVVPKIRDLRVIAVND